MQTLRIGTFNCYTFPVKVTDYKIKFNFLEKLTMKDNMNFPQTRFGVGQLMCGIIGQFPKDYPELFFFKFWSNE